MFNRRKSLKFLSNNDSDIERILCGNFSARIHRVRIIKYSHFDVMLLMACYVIFQWICYLLENIPWRRDRSNE